MANAPYNDESFDIWAISGAVFSESLHGNIKPATELNKWNAVHRVDMFFEMHKREIFLDKIAGLSKCGVPVIMQKKEADIPTSEAYPVEEVARALGEEFSSSIAYMLALAIYRGYEEILIYGVYLMHETEYLSQRPGFKYYLGIARERLIKVWAEENTRLTTPAWRYGYDDIDRICWKISERKKKLEEDMAAQSKVIEDNRAIYFQLRGAAQDCADIIAEIKGGLA
ncbi:MAG: hypothetical protein ACOYB0_09705 [Polynucleobacter sp.]